MDIISELLESDSEAYTLAERYLNPSWVKVLRILGMDHVYTRASGNYLFDREGNRYLDFHSGEGVASLGHNHPKLKKALIETIERDFPDGIQIHYHALSGLLAKALTSHLPSSLNAVFFTNSGAETVDTAMKFARASTKRSKFVSCRLSFHGLSFGPLSLIGEDDFKEGFGPLLPGCSTVPFGDLAALESALKSKDVAGFICEPIQGRTVNVPSSSYFPEVQRLCRKYGTLFILDEIQTGLGRTGHWFALETWGLEPDMVLVAKALSGGFVPVGAMVTRRDIYQKVLGTLDRSYTHHSTYGRNRLAMAAGLATIRIIEEEKLVENAAQVGAHLKAGLERFIEKYDMVKAVRGQGLMLGIEFGPPKSLKFRLNWNLIHAASEGLFPQLIVIPLMRDHRIITMVSGRNDVIKFLPPLTLTLEDANYFLHAMDLVLDECHRSTSNNWKLILDIAKSTAKEKLSALGLSFHES